MPIDAREAFDIAQTELVANETIHWTGGPNPSIVFHSEDWLAIPFSLLWGGFAIFWTLSASGIWSLWAEKPGNSNFQIFGAIWGIPFVLIGQYMIWGRFFYNHVMKKRTVYVLTNRRALAIQKGFMKRSCSSVFFGEFSGVNKSERTDGIGTISFGEPKTTQWRWGRGDSPKPFEFRDVDDIASVNRIAIGLHEAAALRKRPE
jgi:hypothetical protein